MTEKIDSGGDPNPHLILDERVNHLDHRGILPVATLNPRGYRPNGLDHNCGQITVESLCLCNIE